MAFREELARSGDWLFRYRSWIPPLLLPPLALLVAPGGPGLPRLWLGIGLLSAVAGLAVRMLVVGHAPAGTSGKSRLQRAASLTTTGAYSVVRHPLYLANFLLWMGPALATGSWQGPALAGAVFLICYERITFAEEEFLRSTFGREYLEWADRTPAFVPAPGRWVRSALPFSPRTVLRQEYYAWVTTATMFVVLEGLARWRQTGTPSLDRGWAAGFGAVVLTGALLRFLQRRTSLLDADGR